jgi:hypothetical protein
LRLRKRFNPMQKKAAPRKKIVPLNRNYPKIFLELCVPGVFSPQFFYRDTSRRDKN